MKFKNLSLPTIVILLLCITPAVMACCGHCYCGQQPKTDSLTASEKDSIAVKNFSDNNQELLQNIKKNNALIEDEYKKENPDFDRIATLKKGIIDYHTELDKKAAKKKLKKYHHCWCPMHQ